MGLSIGQHSWAALVIINIHKMKTCPLPTMSR
jgi:hypothetical protein